jgi:stress-induced-phosphoprotein 1
MSSANDYKLLGNESFTQKKFDEAIGYYTKAIELNPEDATYYSNRSGCYASLDKYQEALEDAESCLRVNPNFIKGYSRKGLALLRLGKEEEALEAYEAGLKIDPNNDQLLKDKASIEKGAQDSMGDIMGMLNNPEIKKMMQENPQMLQMLLQNPNLFKDPKMMANMMNMMSGMNKKSAPTENTNSAPFKSESNAWNESYPSQNAAKPEASFSSSAKPNQTTEPKKEQKQVSLFESTKAKADNEYKKKNFSEAIALYEECSKIDANNLLVYNNKAACLIEQKKFEEAISCIDGAIAQYKEMDYKDKKSEHLAKLLGRKGRVYHLQGSYKEAIKEYENSLMEDKAAIFEDYLREAKRALKKQEEIAYIDPVQSEKHRENGNTYFSKGEFGKAISEYEEAKKRNPVDAKVYNNIAMCFIKIMKYNEALKEVEKAIEIEPKFVKAYLRKGVIHNLLKEHHKALDAYNQILKFEPDNKEAREGIQSTELKIAASMGDINDEERMKRAMNDPEIASIMSDPMVRIALEQMQANPRNAMEYLNDSSLGPKIQKLIAAGIIKTR